MSLSLSAVITAARDRHPAFHKTRVTDAVFARFLSDYQNELIGKAVARDSAFLLQSAAIVLDLDATNAPNIVGAGTSGGLPGSVAADGSVSVAEESGGALIETLNTVAEGGNVVVADRVVTSVAGQVISSTGAGRTTNQDVGRLIHITSGKGRGQIREVASNTATSWTPTASWTTLPDTTSLFTIIAPTLASNEDIGVVTALPVESSRTGYLVRLNAQGTPYIDYTKPLVVSLDHGVPLPSMLAAVGATVRYTDEDAGPLCITSYARRFDPPSSPAIYFVGEELFLCGDAADWANVLSIEIRYVPVAPAFTATTQYFLLPDSARGAIIAQAAAFAALRLVGYEDLNLDPTPFAAISAAAEDNYLKSLRLAKRGRHSTFREVPYQ